MIAVAVLLWLYASAGLLLALMFMFEPRLGVPCLIGAISVGIGAYLCRRRPGWASILLVVGGILVGGTCGYFGAAVSRVEGQSEHIVAATIFGAFFFGSLPILAGIGLAIGRLLDVIWRMRHGSAVPIE